MKASRGKSNVGKSQPADNTEQNNNIQEIESHLGIRNKNNHGGFGKKKKMFILNLKILKKIESKILI